MDITIPRQSIERLIAEATQDGAKHRAKAEEFLSSDNYPSFHWHSGAAYYAEKMGDYLRIVLDVAEQDATTTYSITQ